MLIEAPSEAIADVLARHEGVRALFDNGWLHLFALKEGRIAARYRPGLIWDGTDYNQGPQETHVVQGSVATT